MDLSRFEPLSELVFRVATSLIFVIGGLGHFVQDDVMLARIEGSPWLELVRAIADPMLLLHVSGAVMLVSGLMLMLGLYTRPAALALFVTLVPITFVIHIAPDHTGPLFKNIAILGALGFFFVRGSEVFSLEKRFLRG